MEKKEILTNLRALGLEAGATSEDIHAAFRKLARELHPDITGSKSDFKFKQVTSAYTILKSLAPEELAELVQASEPKTEEAKPSRPAYDYNVAEKKRRAVDEKIDSIIDKYEEELKNFHVNKTPDEALDMEALALRLKSKNLKVVNAALKHAGSLVNRVEFRRTFVEVLKRAEVDEELADIISSLPLDETNKKLLALDASANAANLPTGLIIAMIGSDSDVMESFLLHVKPDDVAVILRRWPTGKIMNSNVVRRLLENDDARILVPVLGAMKTHFPSVAAYNKKRLQELQNHSVAAVRAWAKKLSN